MMFSRLPIYFYLSFLVFSLVKSNEAETKKKLRDTLKKKDIRDYTDADVETLYEQWEEDDEPLEEDELPEWKRPPPKVDMSQFDPKNPEGILKMSKKGKMLMMFTSISGNPSEKETEAISQLWQTSLYNAHIDVQRYIISSNRVLFVVKDGSVAWEVRDFLVKQERCEVVTLEGKDYKGAGGATTDNSYQDKAKKPSTGTSKKGKKSEL